MARWLCECDRTNAATSAECWSCGRPRPTTTDDVVASLKDALTAATARAERAEALLREVVAGDPWLANRLLGDDLRARIEALLGGEG